MKAFIFAFKIVHDDACHPIQYQLAKSHCVLLHWRQQPHKAPTKHRCIYLMW